MGNKQMKLITVPPNGQISIGTKWAGRQIRIEELSETELHISAGVFVPDSQRVFFTPEAKDSLNEFNKWEQSKRKEESSTAALAQLRKQRQKRG